MYFFTPLGIFFFYWIFSLIERFFTIHSFDSFHHLHQHRFHQGIHTPATICKDFSTLRLDNFLELGEIYGIFKYQKIEWWENILQTYPIHQTISVWKLINLSFEVSFTSNIILNIQQFLNKNSSIFSMDLTCDSTWS